VLLEMRSNPGTVAIPFIFMTVKSQSFCKNKTA
jgi:hypothetical protein